MTSVASVVTTALTIERLVIERLGLIPYQEAWDLQRVIQSEVIAGTSVNKILILEHPSVYTAGRRTEISERPTDGTPVIDVDRGGKITWHGAGQIVGYPILNLDYFSKGVRDYIDKLEEAIILCLQHYGIEGHRLDGATGVWLDPDIPGKTRKICAMGVRVSRGVSMHGFAFNVNTDLSYFSLINPCGFTDKKVTSLQAELGQEMDLAEVKKVLKGKIARVFNMELNNS